MEWYHKWQQNSMKRYQSGYYPGHERMPNPLVLVLYGIGYFLGDFIPLILNFINGIYTAVKRLLAFVANLLIEGSTAVVLVGTIVFSVSHSIEMLRRTGAAEGLEYVGVIIFEVMFISSSAAMLGFMMSRNGQFYKNPGFWFSGAGFLTGMIFVLWSNITAIGNTPEGLFIAIMTPASLLISKGVIAFRYLDEQLTSEPVTEPATEEPATKEPATEEPATKEPATEEPATKEPATEEPATEKPATEEPATKEPATEEPATEEPATKEPATEEASERVASERVASEEVASEEVASEEVASEQVASERVASEEVASEEVASEEVASEEVASEQVASEAGSQRGSSQRAGSQRGSSQRRGSQRGSSQRGSSQRAGSQRSGSQRSGSQQRGSRGRQAS